MTDPGRASMKPGTTDSEMAIGLLPVGGVTLASPSAATAVTLEDPSSVA